MGFLNNLYEKHKGKIAVQASEQLEPGESIERLVLARTEKGGTRQVAAFATDKNVYAADIGLLKARTLKEAKVKFPVAKTRATLDNGKLVLAYNTGVAVGAQDQADVQYDWEYVVLHPEKAAGRDPDDFAAYVTERSTEPEAGASS